MAGAVRAFFDFLAKMGLTIRDDPPRTIDLTSRRWGHETDGFMLSVSAEADVISVILRNVSDTPRHLVVPEFAHWFKLEVAGAEPSAFGKQLLSGTGRKVGRHLDIAAGQAVHAELPIQAVYRLNRDFIYHVGASCAIDNNTVVVSNTINFSLK